MHSGISFMHRLFVFRGSSVLGEVHENTQKRDISSYLRLQLNNIQCPAQSL